MEQNQRIQGYGLHCAVTKAAEIAGIFKVSRSTIYRLAKKGIIPTVHLGRAVRFDILQVYEALQLYRGQEAVGLEEGASSDSVIQE